MAKATKQAAKATGFTNHYREGSSYWAVCEILNGLGSGKFHPSAALTKAFPKVMGDGFAAFRDREARNKETHKGWEDRVVVNAIVVGRPDKYGEPCRRAGYNVLKRRVNGEYEFGLFKVGAAQKVASKPQKPQGAKAKAAKGKTAPKGKAKPSKAGKAKAK